MILCFSFLLLLCACAFAQQQESSNSEELGESSAAQSQEDQGGGGSQIPEESQALSYQEYFSTERPFEAALASRSAFAGCTVFLGGEEGGGLISDGLYLQEGEQEPRLLAEGVASYSVGEKQIYYASGSRIYQVGLGEEEPQVALEADGPIDLLSQDPSLFVYRMGGALYRCYRPTGQTDCLGQTPGIESYSMLSNTRLIWSKQGEWAEGDLPELSGYAWESWMIDSHEGAVAKVSHEGFSSPWQPVPYEDYFAEERAWEASLYGRPFSGYDKGMPGVSLFIAGEYDFLTAQEQEGLIPGWLYQKTVDTGEILPLVKEPVSSFCTWMTFVYYTAGSSLYSLDLMTGDIVLVLEQDAPLSQVQKDDNLLFFQKGEGLYRCYSPRALPVEHVERIGEAQGLAGYQPLSNLRVAWWKNPQEGPAYILDARTGKSSETAYGSWEE